MCNPRALYPLPCFLPFDHQECWLKRLDCCLYGNAETGYRIHNTWGFQVRRGTHVDDHGTIIDYLRLT